MSAAKRRVKRQIARLVRMDASHHFAQFRWQRPNLERQATAARILASMQALGRSLPRAYVDRAVEAINAARALQKRAVMQ